MAFAGEAVLVAHNARFDRSFLDRDLDRMTGRRLAAPVLDTLALARTLLAGRVQRTGLASLSYFFGTATQPCHRALPDAEATGRDPPGPHRARPGAWRAHRFGSLRPGCAAQAQGYDKRSLAHGAPPRPGVYRFYAGSRCSTSAAPATYGRACARTSAPSGSDPRSRPRWAPSTGSSGTCSAQSWRPGWRSCGSSASCAPRRTRGSRVPTATSTCGGAATGSWSRTPSELGPIRSRRQAELAARALAGASEAELDDLLGLGGPLPLAREAPRPVRQPALRGCRPPARPHRRARAARPPPSPGRASARAGAVPPRPGRPAGMRRAFFLADGRVQAVRTVPPGGGALLELEAGVAAARAGLSSWTPNRSTSCCWSDRSSGALRPSSRSGRSLPARTAALPDRSYLFFTGNQGTVAACERRSCSRCSPQPSSPSSPRRPPARCRPRSTCRTGTSRRTTRPRPSSSGGSSRRARPPSG